MVYDLRVASFRIIDMYAHNQDLPPIASSPLPLDRTRTDPGYTNDGCKLSMRKHEAISDRTNAE